MASSLPDDLWQKILEIGVNHRRLSFRDLCSLPMTSHYLRRLSEKESLWCSLLYRDYPSQTWNPSSCSFAKSLYKTRKLTMFGIGDRVEVKGFGKWLGTTLIGHVVGYFNATFYIVNLWSIIDPDHSSDYDHERRDDDYYFMKQDKFQIIHPNFVRDALPDKSGEKFSVGDIVDWNDNCTLRKGIIIRTTYAIDDYLAHTEEEYTYSIKLEASNEIEGDYCYRISPHRMWI